MNLEYEELTEKIIGAAICIQKEWGPGFLEFIYENAFAIEFNKRNILFGETTWRNNRIR